MDARDNTKGDYLNDKVNDNNIHRKAIADFGAAILLNPGNWKLYHARGKAHFLLKHYAEANADFNAALNIKPDAVETLTYSGITYDCLGNRQAANECYNKIIRLVKYAHDYTKRRYAEAAFVNRGRNNRQGGKIGEAENDFRQAILLNPYNTVAYLELGDLYVAQGFYADAINHYFIAVRNNHESCDANERLGSVYSRLGDQAQAIEYYTRAIDLNPHMSRAIYGRASSFLKMRNYAKAVSDFSLMIEITRRNSQAICSRAYAYFAWKNYARAHFDLEKVLALNPDNVWAYLFRGILQLYLEDNRAAEIDFREVWARAQRPHLKLYAGTQLLALNAKKEKKTTDDIILGPLMLELEQQEIRTAEESCVLAIACAMKGKFAESKQACLTILNTYLPEALPHYLQKEYLLLLMNLSSAALGDNSLNLPGVEQFKTQLVDMILRLDDRSLILNAGIQALCRDTMLGGILHIKRGHSKPMILSGRLHTLAAGLDFILQTKSPRNLNVEVGSASQAALQCEMHCNPQFAADLSNFFPHLYKFVKNYLFVQPVPSSFPMHFFKSNTSSIQSDMIEEEGNRFIVDL